jgi:hypothetical protein
MRLAALTLFTLATSVLSLLDGLGATAVAFVLCSVGAALITSRQLAEIDARAGAAHDDVSIRVVRWNY